MCNFPKRFWWKRSRKEEEFWGHGGCRVLTKTAGSCRRRLHHNPPLAVSLWGGGEKGVNGTSRWPQTERMSPFTHSLTPSLCIFLVSLSFCSMCESVALFFSSSLIGPTCQHATVSPCSLSCTLSRISCLCMCCLPVFQHLLLFSPCRTVFVYYLSNPVSAAGVVCACVSSVLLWPKTQSGFSAAGSKQRLSNNTRSVSLHPLEPSFMGINHGLC